MYKEIKNKEANIKISFIIPIYKGNHYINQLLQMIDINRYELNKSSICEVEVLFVNDYPEERLIIKKELAKNLYVRVLQSRICRGIHGARVLGLKQAQGEFVVFLDQDDKIDDSFLLSQIEHIKNADVIICNGTFRNGDTIYSSQIFQESIMRKATYLWITNMIISPGQALIRRDAIPVEWKKIIMKNNGADDYLLWILLLWGKCAFRINREKLYEHVEHENNTSLDTESMFSSENELLSVLKKIGKMKKWEYWLIKRQIIWITTTQGKFEKHNIDLYYVRKWFVNKIMMKVD